MKNKRYLSDIITKGEIEKWNIGDTIVIDGGTGIGKSHFCKNILYADAKSDGKKILILTHRVNCKKQFDDEIIRDNKSDTINIVTYQTLDNDKNFNFSNYKYIVCDEFHYFTSDSVFNSITYKSYKLLLEQHNCIKIYMSATSNTMSKVLYKDIPPTKINDYKIKRDWSFIANNEIRFFNRETSVEEFANQAIKENKKTIFFLKSAEESYNLYKKFKNYSMFCCSKSNKLYKYVDEQKVSDMLKNEKFDCLLLFTTTCLDAGINIIDEDLHHIVTDIIDVEQLIQCVGRKRIQNDDDILFIHVKNYSKREINGWIKQAKDCISLVDYFKSVNYSVAKLQEKYSEVQIKHNPLLYFEALYNNDGKEITKQAKLKINKIMYAKKQESIEIWETMKLTQYGYSDYICNLFEAKKVLLDEEYKQKTLEDYYKNNIIMYTINDRKPLIELLKVNQDGKLLKSKASLNSAFEESKSDYRIKEFNTTINGKRYRHAWKIVKLVENEINSCA